jgi:viroplasmin and RNaseH domain-containing protein
MLHNQKPTKYYAVAKGRVPAIYKTWDDALKNTRGYPGAIYKAFDTLEKAMEYMKLRGLEPVSKTDSDEAINKNLGIDKKPLYYTSIKGNNTREAFECYAVKGDRIYFDKKLAQNACGNDETKYKVFNDIRAAVHFMGWHKLGKKYVIEAKEFDTNKQSSKKTEQRKPRKVNKVHELSHDRPNAKETEYSNTNRDPKQAYYDEQSIVDWGIIDTIPTKQFQGMTIENEHGDPHGKSESPEYHSDTNLNSESADLVIDDKSHDYRSAKKVDETDELYDYPNPGDGEIFSSFPFSFKDDDEDVINGFW